MSDWTIDQWRQWFIQQAQSDLKYRLDLVSIRPQGNRIKLLSDTCDGVHPLLSVEYERKINNE